jgi:hypothetical protein
MASTTVSELTGIVAIAYSISSHSSMINLPSFRLFLAASFTSAKWGFVGSQPMLLALSKPARIDLGENLVGLPAFAGRPAGGHWRIDRTVFTLMPRLSPSLTNFRQRDRRHSASDRTGRYD